MKFPDWRDPANYEYTKSLTFKGWAWEFLRRNPKFRGDYKKWKLASESHRRRRLGDATSSMAKWGLKAVPATIDEPVDDFPLWRSDLLTSVVVLNQDETPRQYREKWSGPGVEFFGLYLNKPLKPQMKKLEETFRRVREAHDIEVEKKSPPKHRRKWRDYLRALDARAKRTSYLVIGKTLFPNAKNPGDKGRDAVTQATSLMEEGYRVLPSG